MCGCFSLKFQNEDSDVLARLLSKSMICFSRVWFCFLFQKKNTELGLMPCFFSLKSQNEGSDILSGCLFASGSRKLHSNKIVFGLDTSRLRFRNIIPERSHNSALLFCPQVCKCNTCSFRPQLLCNME